MLEDTLPAEVFWETVARLGFQQRERKLDVIALVCAPLVQYQQRTSNTRQIS